MRPTAVVFCVLAVYPASAGAGTIRAARTHGSFSIEGNVDEPAWREAFPYSEFVESFPDEGDSPTQRTEVRVLYDDQNLYIGITAYDQQPALIVRGLGRRDSTPTSDGVEVSIDSQRSGRTAYYFSVNAAGCCETRSTMATSTAPTPGTPCGRARQRPGSTAGRRSWRSL